MVTPEGLRRLMRGQTSPSPALQECMEAIDKGDVRQKDPGSLSAQDALSMYSRRRDTTRWAGTTTAGFEEVIAALERCPPAETVQLFHFRGKKKLFTVLVASSSAEILGCLWVTLKLGYGDAGAGI